MMVVVTGGLSVWWRLTPGGLWDIRIDERLVEKDVGLFCGFCGLFLSDLALKKTAD